MATWLDERVIGGRMVRLDELPAGLVRRERLGLVTAEAVDGQVVHEARPPHGHLFETRATITPAGDYLLMFPEGLHYAGQTAKANDLLAYRSSDGGRTWRGPTVAFDLDYNQHAFIPLIPHGSTRLYAFGTQPVWSEFSVTAGQAENSPIGYRWSDDDGHTWSDVELIRPVNDPGFRGMSAMRMCETDCGTWLLGSHAADWSKQPLHTEQYLLRSEDRGETWQVLPGPRPGGWFVPGYHRMDEGRPIALGEGRVLAMFRTPAGQLWSARSDDDGRTWTEPAPTPLIHPDAPPMLFLLSDGRTLAAFHHHRHTQTEYVGLSVGTYAMDDRSELWVSLSDDGGETWTTPRFVLANALAETEANPWYNHQCSYLDAFSDGGILHLFLPYRWHYALHLTLAEDELRELPV